MVLQPQKAPSWVKVSLYGGIVAQLICAHLLRLLIEPVESDPKLLINDSNRRSGLNLIRYMFLSLNEHYSIF